MKKDRKKRNTRNFYEYTLKNCVKQKRKKEDEKGKYQMEGENRKGSCLTF